MKSSVPEVSAGKGEERLGHKPITPLQNGAVYGPIQSRRLGVSLGINPLPVSYKFCDFDCVYCQYGWTPEKSSGEKIKKAAELLREIRTALEYHKDLGTRIQCLTIAGNGEPTIYPEFTALVCGLIEMRNQLFPGVRIGILSDASQSHRPEIRKALELLDDRYMKLDAGTEAKIREINKPKGDFDFERMVQVLGEMKDIVIQSLFVQGSHDNTGHEDIRVWIEKIRLIKPKEVQVYSIDRGPADPGLVKVSAGQLQEIADLCQKMTGVKSVVFD